MLAYIILVAVPILYYFILSGLKTTYGLKEIPYRNSVIWVFFGIFFLLLVLRNPVVGVDTKNYLSKFQYCATYSWKEWILSRSSELGFSVLTKVIRTFTSSDKIYLGAVAAVILYPIAWMYYKESEQPILTFLLFLILPLFAMFFSGFRQSIAISWTVPAYYCVKRKEKLKFILMVVLAIQFHRSAMILFLLYPVYYMPLTRKTMIIIIPIIAIMYLYSDVFYMILIRFMGEFYQERYENVPSTGAYSMLLLFLALLIFSFLFADEGQPDENLFGLRNLLLLSVLLQCFASVSRFAMRINYYFILFIPLLIPRVISRATGKNKFTCKIAEIVLCCYFLYYFLDKSYSRESFFQIYPYIPFWKS